jgi:ABC-2 type transport system permease protein
LQVIAPVAIPPARLMYWSVRRELWENRSIYIAPLAVAGVFLFGFLISLIHLPAKTRAALALNAVQQHAIQQPYMLAAGLLMLTGMIVGVFYCLDALHGERRDRSILFWKSLPVSDVTTVLSKASIPLVVLPFLIVAVTITTNTIMLLASSAVLLGSGLPVATVWTEVSWFHLSLMLFYHLVVVHGLWHAPFYGWLLMVSSWARRAAFLWALLPPLAIGIVEKIAFNTSHFTDLLLYQLNGGGGMGSEAPGRAPFEMLGHFDPGKLLSTPGLWIGLALTAALLAVAVRLRRNQGPI